MALITGSDVDFIGTTGDIWPGAGGTVWDTYTARSSNASRIEANRGGGPTGGITWQRFVKAGAQPASADYEIRAVVYIGASLSPSQNIYIPIRMSSSADTHYTFVFNGAGNYSIQKRVAGTWIGILSGSSGTFPSFTKGTTHTLYFSVSGSTTTSFDVWYDGTQILSGITDTSSPITAQGFAGLAPFSYGTFGAVFESFELHTLTGAALAFGAVPEIGITNGSGTTADLSDSVSGGTPPYTFSYSAGYSVSDMPTGITLDAAGTFSGTASVDGTYTVVFDVTDSAGSPATATSDVVTFTVTSTTNTAPVWQGTDIPDFVFTEGQSATPASLDLTGYWTDSDSFTIATDGTWAGGSGASILSGVLTFDKTQFLNSGSPYTLRAKATDTGANVTYSNYFTVTVNAATSNVYSVTTPVLDMGAGDQTVLASTAVSWIWFPTDMATSLGNTDWVTGTGTTSVSGTLTTTATLPVGAGYLMVYSAGWAGYWFGPLTAS